MDEQNSRSFVLALPAFLAAAEWFVTNLVLCAAQFECNKTDRLLKFQACLFGLVFQEVFVISGLGRICVMARRLLCLWRDGNAVRPGKQNPPRPRGPDNQSAGDAA